jgi:hypothetical protein
VKRALGLILLVAGCGPAPTSLFIELTGMGVSPTSLSVSVYDPHGPLVLDRLVQGTLPGSLLVDHLPNQREKLRLAFSDGQSGAVLGDLVATIVAHQETHASVTLMSGVADADHDGVPDAIDNCPNTPNHDQYDGDANGVGNQCEGGDGGGLVDLAGPFDLAGADLAGNVCTAWFCDGFESDIVNSSEQITTPSGALRWTIEGDMDPEAQTELDFTTGALGSAHSLRFRLTPDLNDGGAVVTYQRYDPDIHLQASANLAKILNGPTYIRFFVKMSQPPSVVYDPRVAIGYVFWGTDETNNLELDANTSGVNFNTRFTFGSPMENDTPVAVDWVSDWVCVEWSNQTTGADGGATTQYHSTVKVNGVVAATFDGTGTPAVFGGFLFGPDIQFRSDTPNLLSWVQWIDGIKIDGQPIGCN